MKTLKAHAELVALRQLALDDLLSMSDDELRQEAREAGEDMDMVADSVRHALRETASAMLRERLSNARQRAQQAPIQTPGSRVYPAVEQIKRLIQRTFESEQALGLAFRAGKQQTESDWQSLYDDLIEMGAIVPDEDAH